MRRFILVPGLAVLLWTLTARATDLEFGADGLSYLTDKAKLVVEVAEKGRRLDAPSSSPFALFAVRSGRVLKGRAPQVREITVAVARSLGEPKEEAFAQSTVFLAREVTADEKKRWQVSRQESVFVTVSGRFGVVRSQTEAGRKAVADFVSRPQKERLDWAKDHVSNVDPYLQRCAVLELANHPGDKSAPSLLESVLRPEKGATANKPLAIQALMRCDNSEGAVDILVKVAENPHQPLGVRLSAVDALGSLRGGEAVLKKWLDGKDKFLPKAARETLQKYRLE